MQHKRKNTTHLCIIKINVSQRKQTEHILKYYFTTGSGINRFPFLEPGCSEPSCQSASPKGCVDHLYLLAFATHQIWVWSLPFQSLLPSGLTNHQSLLTCLVNVLPFSGSWSLLLPRGAHHHLGNFLSALVSDTCVGLPTEDDYHLLCPCSLLAFSDLPLGTLVLLCPTQLHLSHPSFQSHWVLSHPRLQSRSFCSQFPLETYKNRCCPECGVPFCGALSLSAWTQILLAQHGLSTDRWPKISTLDF